MNNALKWHANATAESGDRFYGAVFVGCGVAWLWGAMQDPLPAKLFRFLAAIMLLGGMGRVIAFAAEGRPHQMFIGLTVVEFVFPALVFFLASNRDKATADCPLVPADLGRYR